MTKKICIAIDGPAAAGKSTVAKIVAKKLQFVYIDTGAMYRAVTYITHKNKIDYTNEKAIAELLAKTVIRFEPGEVQQVFVNEENVTEVIRSLEVTNHVSIVAAHPAIREALQERQQVFAKEGGIVMDGRDIGTAVLPNAELKVFLLASVEERAERRFKENVAKGFAGDLNQLKKEIEERDHLDYTREHSPLKKAVDAIEVDTTSMTIDDVANKILFLAEQKIHN
ncbi:(d)CMP kinase [Listeria ivanovii]|uniref:Cytidylate kinase n=1 Tax=Listeria ivanovii (strain ATCC BAA-678 / PAM 55) TaxID=881621 RepID=G2ZCM6_LISIP|nr:(d)CMP kinase [Listeria ivanovii]AHI56452.1 cytidylate kinase [Listeria ivanovii WSLC3009]AIS65875.1 cytidylate kinase [Listeria ivanovii subsp. ivanovii]MBC1759089.1 (d)CMP kinase [Listeria ivanovii]MBK3914113.1 (d)CMP kinase [Listeria ivanovii subsp. ivanovii]MBK3921049.1 (d)CMP kinase [Listeria ivanovii subsp. ivanovii]